MKGNPYGVTGQRAPDQFVAWNSEIRRSRNQYFRENPPEVPKPFRCSCGTWWPSERSLRTHRRRTPLLHGRAS